MAPRRAAQQALASLHRKGESMKKLTSILLILLFTYTFGEGPANSSVSPQDMTDKLVLSTGKESASHLSSTLNSKVRPVKMKVTFYGFPDNDDGQGHFGTNVIAHAVTWRGHSRNINPNGDPIAGGIGTYDNPITAAARKGNRLLRAGTLAYVSGLKKYFILEDECASCSTDKWIDLWMESNASNNADSVKKCEDDWTGDDTELRDILINPPANLEVNPAQFFDTRANKCNAVTW
jgi:hypothetical protein